MEAGAKGASENNGKTIGVVSAIFSRSPNKYIQKIIGSKKLI